MTRNILLTLIIVILIGNTSCRDDADAAGDNSIPSESLLASFTLNIPHNQTGKEVQADTETYAMDASNEGLINDIYLIAFLKDGSNYKYWYKSKGSNIRIAGSKVTFNVDLKTFHGNNGSIQRFILVANCDNVVPDLEIIPREDIYDVADNLIFKSTMTDGNPNEWDIDTPAPIPMYCMTGDETIKDETTSIGSNRSSNSNKLVRMLSRCDIKVHSTLANKFKLVNGAIFNRKNQGHIAYNTRTNGYWDATNGALQAWIPSVGTTTTKLPTGSTAAGAIGSGTYAADYSIDSKGLLQYKLYSFEAKGVNAADYENATAIVVGAKYDPTNTGNFSGPTVYYRIDIPKFISGSAQRGTMGDILRNRLYTITVKTASTNGARTQADAFDRLINVEASVAEWNLADMDDIKLNDIYGLRVNKTKFVANNSAGLNNNNLTVYTDYDDGWSATLIPASASSWVSFAPGTVLKGNGYEDKTLTFDIKPNANRYEIRHAVLKIRAGHLFKNIDIYQSENTSDILDWSESSMNEDGQNLGEVNMYFLRVSRTKYNLSKNAQNDIPLLLYTDYPSGWKTTVDVPWITITANGSSTGPDSQTLTFNVGENTTRAQRTGTITVTAGHMIKKIVVVQDNISDNSVVSPVSPWDNSDHDNETDISGISSEYNLTVSRTKYDLPKNALNDIPLDLYTDNPTGWKVKTDDDWITITANESTTGPDSKTLIFKVDENTTRAQRRGTIIVTAGHMIKKVVVIQSNVSDNSVVGPISPWDNSGNDNETGIGSSTYNLNVSRTKYDLSKNAQSNIPLVLYTDNPSGWKTSSDSWITITDYGTSSGPGSQTLKFKVDENPTRAQRIGTIIITAGNMIKKIVVIQSNVSDNSVVGPISPWDNSGHDNETSIGGSTYNLNVSRTKYELSKNAQIDLQLVLYTDNPTGWKTTVDRPWITITDNGLSNVPGSKTLKFKVDENPTRAPRAGTIIITAGNMIKKIVVKQSNVSDNSVIGPISPWDNSGNDNETDISGISNSYNLNVSRTKYDLSKNAQIDLPLVLYTDNPTGWKTTVDRSWITITDNGLSNVPGSKTLKFKVDENPTRAPRTGTIIITAGNMIKKIVVKQSNVSDNSVVGPISPWDNSGNDNETDISGISNSYNLNVSRTKYELSKNVQSNIPLVLYTNNPTGWKTTVDRPWITITDNGLSNVPGSKTLTFKVSENTTRAQRTGTITVTAGNMIKKIVVIQSNVSDNSVVGPISPWDNGGHENETDVAGITRYGLSVSRSKYEFLKNAKSNNLLQITTNNPTGWKTTVDQPWITITANESSAGPASQTLAFKVEENTTRIQRTGTITITAGRLIKKIVVIQSNVSENPVVGPVSPWVDSGHDSETNLSGNTYELSVSRSNIISDCDQKSFTLDVTMVSNKEYGWTASTTASWITLDNDKKSGISNSTSPLSFKLGDYNGSTDRVGEIIIRFGNNGNSLKKVIKVRQYAGRGIKIDNLKNSYEQAVGMKHNFTIKAKSAWTAEVITNKNVVNLLRINSGLAEWNTGIPFEFTLKATGSARQVTIKITSTTGEFNPYTVTINTIP